MAELSKAKGEAIADETKQAGKCRQLTGSFDPGCSRAELQTALLVLIQHNCIQPYVLEQDEGSKSPPQTVFLPDLLSILNRLRYSWILQPFWIDCHAQLAGSCIIGIGMTYSSALLSVLQDLAYCACPCFLLLVMLIMGCMSGKAAQ